MKKPNNKKMLVPFNILSMNCTVLLKILFRNTLISPYMNFLKKYFVQVLNCSCPLHLLPGHRGARGYGETGGSGRAEATGLSGGAERAEDSGGTGERLPWRGLWGRRGARSRDQAVRQEEPQRYPDIHT